MTLTKMFGALFLTESDPMDKWVMVKCVECGTVERMKPGEVPDDDVPYCGECGGVMVPAGSGEG